MKKKIEEILKSKQISYELIPLPEELPPDVESHMKFHGHPMKYAMPNIIFKTEKGLVVVQKRGDSEIDNKKLKKALGIQRLSFASKEDLEALELQPGIVPPLGYGLPFYMDKKVLEQDEVYTGTGDKLFALKINPKDLEKLNNATVGDFTVGISSFGKVVFSGVQPSGDLHIGNYIGALNQWVNIQQNSDAIFCIVDLHAITVPQDSSKLQEKIKEVAALYLAAGIDPAKAHIFVQSENPDHAQLAWILNCITPFGQLERMTQFKDKSDKYAENTTAGLFDYPVLMAADILLYQTDEVPVGQDQKQHIELTRDLAEKFNRDFGPVFKLPNPVIGKDSARIMSLTDPTVKMGKSDINPASRINLLDTEEEIRTKIKKAVTDSGTQISKDSGGAAISNLVSIYAAFNGQSFEDAYNDLEGKSYGEFKNVLSDLVVKKLLEIQKKYQEIRGDEGTLRKILDAGRDYAISKSSETLRSAKKAIGLVD